EGRPGSHWKGEGKREKGDGNQVAHCFEWQPESNDPRTCSPFSLLPSPFSRPATPKSCHQQTTSAVHRPVRVESRAGIATAHRGGGRHRGGASGPRTGSARRGRG